MTTKIMDLPSELIDLILVYSGYHRWHKGKYRRQLSSSQRVLPLELIAPWSCFDGYYYIKKRVFLRGKYYEFVLRRYSCWQTIIDMYDCKTGMPDSGKHIYYVHDASYVQHELMDPVLFRNKLYEYKGEIYMDRAY